MNLRFECFKLAWEISNKTEIFCAATMRSKSTEEIEKAWQQVFIVAKEINEFCNNKPKINENDLTPQPIVGLVYTDNNIPKDE